MSWGEVVLDLLDKGATAIGYRNAGEPGFNFIPKKDDAIKSGATVKYIAKDPLK